MAPATMNAMLSVQGQAGQSGQAGLVNGDAFSSQLFSLLDGNSDGGVSKSEFEAAFGQNGNTAKADSIFAKLDANGDGSVSQDELTSALQKAGGAHHHRHHGGGAEADSAASAGGTGGSASGGAGSADDLLGSDTSQTVANSDGSSTITISYADGSQVTMTTPAANGSGSGTGATPHNVIEQMIQRQAQMLATSAAGQSLAISA
jgi:hypothetical protein